MIPKTIHYCWFGHNPKNDIIKKCIESWKTIYSDYTIQEWNEDNFDIDFCSYSKNAYAYKKWAFVSDVARIWAVYTHGGIYLDTDVELLQPFKAELLESKGFFFFQNARTIASGLGFGMEKDGLLLKVILNKYKELSFNPNHLVPCPVIETDILCKMFPGYKRNNERQDFDGFIIETSKHYCGFAKHYGLGCWAEGQTAQFKFKTMETKCI